MPLSRCGSAAPMWNTLQVDSGVALFEAPGQSTTTRRRCTCQHCKHRRPPAHLHLLLGLESQNRSVQTMTASRFTLIEHSYFPAHFRFHSGVPRQAPLYVLRRKVITSVWNVKVMPVPVCRKKFLTLRFVAAKLFAVKTLPYYPTRRHFEGSVKQKQ